jgi:hypothetical protein
MRVLGCWGGCEGDPRDRPTITQTKRGKRGKERERERETGGLLLNSGIAFPMPSFLNSGIACPDSRCRMFMLHTLSHHDLSTKISK